MVKVLEKGKDRVQKICDILRVETLEPAQNEGKKIIQAAREEAERIIQEGREQAKNVLTEARAEIEKEKAVCKTALDSAAKQSLGTLRQLVENKIFDEGLQKALVDGGNSPPIIADLIAALAQAIQKEGMSADFDAVVSTHVSSEAMNALLSKEILQRLKNQAVTLGTFAAGLQMKLEDKKITIDITDAALKELLAKHLRKEFRKYVFGEDQ